MYIASVGVYSYEKDYTVVEAFKMSDENWKRALLMHSEFAEELSNGDELKWLSSDLEVAKKQLDNNDLQVDIVFTEIPEYDDSMAVA